MSDISGYSLQLQIIGSVTFPAGFNVSQFADDSDPLDIPSIQIADKAMGLNGDLVTWSKATPLGVTVAVIPGSDDDKNLFALFEANRPGKGKRPAGDVITFTAIYPDQSTRTFTAGKITDGPPAIGVASAGRKKTSVYQFAFENSTGTQ